MIKILIADDHPSIRKGVKQILTDEFSEIEFGEAASASEVLKKVKEKEWNVLIMDMDMPGRSGLEALKQLKEEDIDIKVLIFSLHPEEQVALRALKAGAYGYLSKDAADGELVKAIRLIMTGKRYITPTVAEQLAKQLENPEDKAPHEFLSDREYQTLLLIASGKTVSEIAEALSLSTPTISTYRMRILEKMHMKTSAELTTYAIRSNLV
ncbi:MAG: response regulator transcription factor [Bacteroidetes bacterium]|nr:response regulator transcription factor [Bacteroidota bacterium]